LAAQQFGDVEDRPVGTGRAERLARMMAIVVHPDGRGPANTSTMPAATSTTHTSGTPASA
jgi:hypothetical protein